MKELKENDRPLNKRQLSDYLQCSLRQVDYLREKGLPSMKLGGMIRFDFESVRQWLKAQETQNNGQKAD